MTLVSLDALTTARAADQQSTETAVRVVFSRAMRLLDAVLLTCACHASWTGPSRNWVLLKADFAWRPASQASNVLSVHCACPAATVTQDNIRPCVRWSILWYEERAKPHSHSMSHSPQVTYLLGPPQDANLVRGLQRIGQALLQIWLPFDALHAASEPCRLLKLTNDVHGT